MFVSPEHHPQLLAQDCYHSQQQFERELAQFFRPAWHCVGAIDELPRDGSFRTLDLLGHPLLVWRKDGEIHAMLNVCSHRFCKISSAECGQSERLKCQYHGWEYDSTGNVRKIPDARTFRPLEPGMLGLKKYHAATCGRLVFVSLHESPPSLAEFLGPGFEICRQWFSGDELCPVVVVDREIEANWKVLVENALESYHTTEVHPRTFGTAPPEDACRHDLEPGWTSLTVSYAGERSARRWLDDLAHRLVGAEPTNQYEHRIYYPHVMLSRLSLYRWIECIHPISPSRSRSVVRVFWHPGRSRGLWRRWNAFTARQWAHSFLMRVGAEDAAIMPSVQRGLSSPDQPLGGLISTREERVFHFQRQIQSGLADPRGDVDVLHRPAPTGAESASTSVTANFPRGTYS